MYDWLPDYDTFTANFLLQLFGPTTIKHGDSAGIVLPVLLPKEFALEELKPRSSHERALAEPHHVVRISRWMSN